MGCKMPRLLCRSLRRTTGKWSGNPTGHLQMGRAFSVPSPCPTWGPAHPARSPVTSSSWHRLKRLPKKSRQPPSPRNSQTLAMFSCRRRLERSCKTTTPFPVTLTSLSRTRSRGRPWQGVGCCRPPRPLAAGRPTCTWRHLCCSSPWLCTGWCPGSASRPPWARSPLVRFMPGPSQGGASMTPSLLHHFSPGAPKGNHNVARLRGPS